MKFRYAHALTLALAASPMLVGCGGDSAPPATTESAPVAGGAAEEHDLHDKPLTEAEIEALKGGMTSYDVAVAKVNELRDSIRDAIAAGHPPEAHRPLDELDIVLGHLTAVARDNDIPKSQWETINTTAQRIRELFNQVHAQIDAGETPDYGAVADEIQSAFEKLEAVESN